MSKWLDLSNVSNKFKQSYVRGFVDISGGGLLLRNDGSLNIYNSTDLTNPKFSIKSDQMHIYDGLSSYYDVSNNKIIYLKNVSGDIQTQINTLNTLTKYINSDLSNGSTILELDNSGKLATIFGNLKTTGKITGFYDLSINGNVTVGNTITIKNGLTVTSGNLSLPENSISYTAVSGGVNTSTNQTIDGIKTFSKKTIFNGDISLNGQLYLTGNNNTVGGTLTVGNTLSISNGLTVTSGSISFPPNSIAPSAIQGGLPYIDLATDQTAYGIKTFGNDAYFDGNVFANNLYSVSDSSFGGNVFVNNLYSVSDSSFGGNVFANNLYSVSDSSFGGNVTFNSAVYVLADMSINGNILLGGDISINGNIHFPPGSIAQNAISAGGIGIYIGATEQVSFDDDMFAVIKEGPVKGIVPTQAVFEKTITAIGDVSFNGNVFMTSKIYAIGDISATGNLFAVTQPIIDNSTKVATTAFVQNQGYTTPQTLFRQFT